MKEENEAIKTSPFMNATELEENIKTSLRNLKKTISTANPLTLMIQLHVQKLLRQFGNLKEGIYGNLRPSESKLLDFTQSIIVSSDLDIASGYLDENEVNNYLHELDTLYTDTSFYVNHISSDELIRNAQGVQMNVSGI